jgi:hypothetical protein
MASMDFSPESTFIGPIDTQVPLERRVAQLSEQLSSIRINNTDQRTDLDSLFDELTKIKSSFKSLANDIKDINSMKTLYTDFVQLKLNFDNETKRLQLAINGLLQSVENNRVAIQQNSSQLIELARLPPGNTQEVPELQYAQFTGNPRETKRFVYFIQEKLQEKGHCFPSEKAKINWIVRHFCHPNGNLGENIPSYNWWMALLFENARIQSLPTKSASTKDPYVLNDLLSAKAFLSHLEEVFSNKHDGEEAKKRLFSFKQGNRPIEEFNALFNSLAYSVNLTEESRCDIYEQALNLKVLKIAVMRNNWKSATKLKEKQLLAISAAEAQDKISSIDTGSLPSIQRRPPPPCPQPPPPPPTRIPEGVTPMDLDNISSDTAFTFPKFRALCVQRGICQRCGQQFDDAQKKVRGCILPDGQHMDIKRKIELFRQWSSSHGQSVSQIETIHPNYNPNRPRQSTSPNPLASISSGPSASDPTISTGSADRVILDQIPPLSLADYCLDQAIDEMEVEPLNFCMSPDSYLSLPFSSSRPILKALINCQDSDPIEASILFDSGASASFIDFNFVRRNRLHLSQLHQSIQCRGFDSTLAKSGNIHSCWQGHIRFPAKNLSLQSFPVLLLVTNLASADIILGFPWLSKNQLFVGGSPQSLLVPRTLFLSEVSIQDLPSEIKQFSDVFVTNSLSCLPPNREGYDCEINLKPDSKPPFVGMYHLSEQETLQLKQYVSDLKAKGFIRDSSSPAGAPIFFVKTPGKADRPFVDYRQLNAMTVHDSYPLPVYNC